MINHDDVYCDITINGNKLNCAIKHIHIQSQINQPFKAKINIACSEPINFFQKNLHQPCQLKISAQDYPNNYLNGILTSTQLINKNIHEDYIYELTIKPAIALFTDETYPYLFNSISAIDIAKQILSGRGLNTTPQDYIIKLKGDRNYPPLYRILMNDESILEFFNRILSYQGLAYFFDHTTAKSPLIITDALNDIATIIDTAYIPNSPHALTLKPYIETLNFTNNHNLPQKVLSTGAPRLEPHTLFAESKDVIPANASTLYHLNTNEQLDDNAKTRANISSLAFQGEQNTADLIGGGLLFAGMNLNLQSNTPSNWLIRASTIEITFDEHDQYRLGSIATKIFAQDASIRYQALPQFGEHATLMSGIALGTPSTDKGNNLISVNEQGHYHATLPININSNSQAQDVQVFDTRMLQPMHSNDHSSHLTLPSDSEGILLWSEGFSGEPLILGTLNNSDNIHPTTINNPQNAYWQDNDTNKVGFVNEGNFTPYQKTGRNTASIIEAPSYDPDNNQSYVRMGDAINNDNAYPSRAAEPGIFVNTSGNYQEEHQGGIATLAGNLNQDSQNAGFTPTLRQMVQAAPALGSYHILDSSTAHLHDNSLTSDNVTETHAQDASTINKNLSAEQNLQNYNVDTTDNIYVNQNQQTQGDYNVATYNKHTLNSQSTTTNILETSKQTSENHDSHTLNLNHLNNQFNTQTQTTNINSQTTSITTLTQNFKNYSGQANTLSINSQNTNITANNASIGGKNFQQGGLLSVSNGGAAPNIPDIHSMNQQGINAINNEQAQENQIQNTLHPDIRKINMQYHCPAELQMPEAYFNRQGQLSGYIGIRQFDKAIDLNTNPINST